MTPGQKIAEEAFAAFDAWCQEWDPESEMSMEVQAANYQRTCTLEDEIERLCAEVAALRGEIELWKDRHAAADQALDATIKDYERDRPDY